MPEKENIDLSGALDNSDFSLATPPKKPIFSVSPRTRRVLLFVAPTAVVLVFALGVFLLWSNSSRDCGENADCLIAAAAECERAEAILQTVYRYGDQEDALLIRHKVEGRRDQSCGYSQTLLASKTSSSATSTQSLQFSKYQGTTSSCLFTTDELSKNIQNWEKRGFVAGDFEQSDCSGGHLEFFVNATEETSSQTSGPSSQEDPVGEAPGGGEDTGGSEDTGGEPEELVEEGTTNSPQDEGESEEDEGGEDSPTETEEEGATPPPPPPPSPLTCQLSGPTRTELPPGAKTYISVQGYQGSTAQIVWRSTKPSVADVTPGVGAQVTLEAYSLGTTELVVTDNSVPGCKKAIPVSVIN